MESAVRAFLLAARGGRLDGDLKRTPRRVALVWRDEILSGYSDDPRRILIPLRGAAGRDPVAVRGLDFVSTCAHHLLPFHGKVHLAYLPSGSITGVSRLAQLVLCLSRRLQIQEDLTRQITSAIEESLRPRGAACVIEATHLCMTARGGRSHEGVVVTSAFSGVWERDPAERAHVLGLLGLTERRSSRSARRALRPGTKPR
jgi:GTP cyclohydrolase I